MPYRYRWDADGCLRAVPVPGGIIPLQAQQMAYVQAAVAPPIINLADEEGNMINDFMVGCDPEFMLLDGGLTVGAHRYFTHAGEIGYDHGGRVAEFRPSPTRGILPIMKKLQNLVSQAALKAAGRRFRAGAICNDDCLGGHIHFGFNCFAQKPPQGLGVHHGGVLNERGKKVTEALDALTKTLEFLDILPANESAKRRASAQGQGAYYGAYGDVRDCHGHMEYRTMASWLYDPKVAFLCLTAAKLAAADPEGALEGLRRCEGFPQLRRWLEQYENKDVNAKRLSEKLLAGGLRPLQVDPGVDFKERWGELGI